MIPIGRTVPQAVAQDPARWDVAGDRRSPAKTSIGPENSQHLAALGGPSGVFETATGSEPAQLSIFFPQPTVIQRVPPQEDENPRASGGFRGGRYWARTSDPQLVDSEHGRPTRVDTHVPHESTVSGSAIGSRFVPRWCANASRPLDPSNRDLGSLIDLFLCATCGDLSQTLVAASRSLGVGCKSPPAGDCPAEHVFVRPLPT